MKLVQIIIIVFNAYQGCAVLLSVLPCAYRRFIGVAPLSCGRVDGTDGGFHLKSIRVYRPRTSLSAEFSIDEAPAAPKPRRAL